MFKNTIELKQCIVLSLYTITVMVLLEILTLPFSINKYILTFSPFIGINFSGIAVTIYLILFVTAIRLNGSRLVK